MPRQITKAEEKAYAKLAAAAKAVRIAYHNLELAANALKLAEEKAKNQRLNKLRSVRNTKR